MTFAYLASIAVAAIVGSVATLAFLHVWPVLRAWLVSHGFISGGPQ